MTLLVQLTQRDIVFPSESGLGCCWALCTARAEDRGFCHPQWLWSSMPGKTPEDRMLGSFPGGMLVVGWDRRV